MVQYNLKVENNIAERAIEKTLSQLKKNPSISLTKNGNVIRIKTISNGREIIRKSTPVKLHRKERRVATIKDDKDDNLM
ncbi:MAG: hypothetical protein LH473_11690, partial [Chitinophagales bacterium]|nr:hypothetical protein [Chitinophagales bacterium]